MKNSIIVWLLALPFFACKTEKKEKNFDAQSYEKTKETLADKEKNNPARFLKIENKDRKNIIGQTVVIAHITNKATICTYKDVEVKLSFYSQTKTKLDEGIETVYETIPPGETIKFKTKYFAPKGTDSVAMQVLKAIGEVQE